MHADAAAAAAACMRACVVARVIDTMYQLIYSSAQTQAWRIEFSYRNIRESYARSKGRARDAASRARPYDHSQKGGFQITLIVLLCNKVNLCDCESQQNIGSV